MIARVVELLLFVAVCATLAACSADSDPAIGASPDDDRVELTTVQGDAVELRAGTPRLVAWLAVTGDAAIPSKPLVPPLESVARQHDGVRLQVVLIATAPDGEVDADAAVNAGYDWHADPVPLAVDTSANQLQSRHDITTVPTVLLLNAAGTEVRRWEGHISPGELALALDDIGAITL